MNKNHNLELARSRAREILSGNNIFRNLQVKDQKNMYQQVVAEQLKEIENEGKVSMGLAPGFKDKASDLINDKRHDDALDFSNAGEALEDIMEAVDFPKFVSDLLIAVFDANMDVMKSQTDVYIKLMKEATTGLAKFIKQIDIKELPKPTCPDTFQSSYIDIMLCLAHIH